MNKISIILTSTYLLFLFRCDSLVKNSSPEGIPSDYILWDKYPYPNEENLKHQNELLLNEQRSLSSRSPQDIFSGSWETQGPGNIGGRVSAIAIHPKDEKIIYLGYSNGGLFKSINDGLSWNSIFDKEITLSIGAIALDPLNPEIIFIGTGDPDINGNSYIGNGLFKSTNGGKTWMNIGLQDVRVINEIIIDPINSSTIYVAAMGNPFEANINRGVYKSINSGISWTKVLFVSNQAGITDLALNPKNSNELYACSFHRIRTPSINIAQGLDSKIFKSIDGGNTWNEIMNGITKSEFSRIAIALSPSEPNILYARIVKNDTICSRNSSYNMEGLYKSINSGQSWTRVPINYNTIDCDYLGGFGWYFGQIAIHPINPNNIYLLGVDLWQSTDGGINWNMGTPPWQNYIVHADKHELVFYKNNDFLLGTDGGLYKYSNKTNAWSDIENIATTQFYRVALNPSEPDLYYGGAQDNGTSSGNKNSINQWNRVFGGDGFQAGFHSRHPEYAWYEYQYGNLYKYDANANDFFSFKKGITGTSNWDTPYFLSIHNEDSMYYGSNKVFLNTTPQNANWTPISPDITMNGPFLNYNTPTITCMAESPIVQENLIAGTTNGNVWIGNTALNSWKNITGSLPPGYVTNVEASTVSSETFFVSFSNYRNNNSNAYIYKSIDNGTTWHSIASNQLEQIPINDFTIVNNTKDSVIIAATLLGVYATMNGGMSWFRVGSNLPLIPINSILYNPLKKEIVAGTFARSIWTYAVDNFTKIPNLSENKNTINLYPNYIQELLQFELPSSLEEKILELRVIDIHGKTAMQKSIIGRKINVVNLNNMHTGKYYLCIHSKSKSYSSSFIKI